jgi:hypothetical protein
VFAYVMLLNGASCLVSGEQYFGVYVKLCIVGDEPELSG